eukprot:9502788-Pyramimonas_sp.AAC.1
MDKSFLPNSRPGCICNAHVCGDHQPEHRQKKVAGAVEVRADVGAGVDAVGAGGVASVGLRSRTVELACG